MSNKELFKVIIKINSDKSIKIELDDDPEDTNKIQTNLSVPQIAYLFKIFHKSGIVTNKRQMDIFRFIIKNIKSSKVDSISQESLRTKYYNVEDSTKKAVKKLLLEMMSEIEKEDKAK